MKGETKAETKVDSSKGKAVELAVTQIERQYGKGAIMKLGDGQFHCLTFTRIYLRLGFCFTFHH